MAKGIIGFCRFSFLGLGDWVAYRKLLRDRQPISEEVLQDVAARIYEPSRLAQRFWLFEHVLLPSIRGQTDQDFTLIVLTSPEMPKPWLDRLHALVANTPAIRVSVSQARTCREALLPEIARCREENGGQYPIQFRVDDDDCLAINYISTLRNAADRLDWLKTFTITMPQFIMLTAYSGEPDVFSKRQELSHSAGCAYYTEDPGRTIFSIAHTLLHLRAPTLVLPTTTSAFMTKFDDHDSDTTRLRESRRGHEAMTTDEFRAIARVRFPFLTDLDFTPARQFAAGVPKAPASVVAAAAKKRRVAKAGGTAARV